MSERAFYILKTAENDWSRDVMLLQVENDLYRNQGKAINNFYATLPEFHSAWHLGKHLNNFYRHTEQ